MLSLWAALDERDVEAYVGTLILPSYLAHLRLEPFSWPAQPSSRDGREALKLTYSGQGRLEELALEPGDHVLAMIRSVCPGVETSRLHLPRDDAAWHWPAAGAATGQCRLRVYFAPAAQALGQSGPAPPPESAYVSVTRQHVFIGRALIERYVEAWLRWLGIAESPTDFDLATPDGGVGFHGQHVGGCLLLDDDAMVEDLVRFAGLQPALAELRHEVRVAGQPQRQRPDHLGPDGVHFHLICRDELAPGNG